MATHDEHQRIAAAMNALRPEWHPRSLVTYLDRNHYARAYRDLAVAAVVVALDERTETPKLLEQHGAWWIAAGRASGQNTPTPPRHIPCDEPGHTGDIAHCPECIAN